MMNPKSIHISKVPPRLIEVRDNWRYFWRWVPILGLLYEKFTYHKAWNKWNEENPDIFAIKH